MGESLLHLKKYKQAEGAYKDALRFSKERDVVSAVNFGLGEVYKALGQKSNAISSYKKAAQNRDWKEAAEREVEILNNPDKYQ